MNQPLLYKSDQPLKLESGVELPGIEIAYHTYGTFNPLKNNVVWICHALTANSDAEEWWPGVVGEGCIFNTTDFFIVCANVLGSCYGTTGPASINPKTGKAWYLDFPAITTRDLVSAHELLRVHLGIQQIHTVTGGSIGAHQAMEWAMFRPQLFQHLIVIAAGAFYTPWGVAFNESQRLALEADISFRNQAGDAGQAGLLAARSIALLSYRNHAIYNKTQADDPEKTSDFKASSYQRYQGLKLVKRFNAHAYYVLLNTLDSHNVGRGRGGPERALAAVKAKTLVIGISSDYLFPVEEQQFLANHINHAVYAEIDSLYGHDGFLVEAAKLSTTIRNFYNNLNN
ncbi:MAG: homoserine O-acetyltransferase [Lentimicrobium sp.]|nr:homoserine O-acetyltransferase [Lentimicrobium sp.]